VGERGPAFDPTVASDPALANTATRAPREAVVTLAIGQRVGDRYVVRAFLGEGGMGAVYRALDEKLDEEVALKVVRGALGTSSRLRDEVRLAQKVTHPYVCRTYDLEEVDGLHFVKMEYVVGETLAHALAAGKLPIARAIPIARKILAGLAAAHVQGIVHRDLKPGNVMLSGERVVLMDFGLAQKAAAESDIAGTPGYMAPEQLAGAELDGRADLYALGCVLYEMLAGERVPTAGAIDVRAKRPDAPRWLARATALLLAKEPRVRPDGARLLGRGPRRWPFAVAALLVVAAGATAYALATRRSTWTPIVRDIEPVMNEWGGPASFSPDGKRLAYISRDARSSYGVTYVQAIDAKTRERVLDRSIHARWTYDGTAILDAMQDRLIRRPLDRSPSEDLGQGDHSDACGPDAIATSIYDNAGSRLELRARDGARRLLARIPNLVDAIVGVRCDRVGERVLYLVSDTFSFAAHGDLFVVDRAGTIRQVTAGKSTGPSTFTPSGTIVLSRRVDDDIQLYEMTSDGTEHQLTFGDGVNTEPEVSPDGTRLVFDRRQDYFTIVVADSGGEAVEIPARRGHLNMFDVDRNGKRLVANRTTSTGNRIVRIDVTTGDELDLAPGIAPSLSRDGKRVLFHDEVDDHVLREVSIDGGAVRAIATLPYAIVNQVIDAEDGIHLWLAHDTIDGWLVTADGNARAEGVAGLVHPAPSGGWRAVVTPGAPDFRVRFVAPGQPLSAPGPEIRSGLNFNTWLDDHTFAYATVDAGFESVDVTAIDQRTRIGGAGRAILGGIGRPGYDRRHWFTLQLGGTTQRRELVNFDARPWK
jgi:hypothetical protein